MSTDFEEKKVARKKKKCAKKSRKVAAKLEVTRKANQPIGGKCPECGLRIRSSSLEAHKHGMSHRNHINRKKG